VHSAEDWEELLLPEIERQQKLGKQVVLRADAAFAKPEIYEALLRQRIYQHVAGYEDANDADRLRGDPLLQIVADQKVGHALGSQPTLSRWEYAPSGDELVNSHLFVVVFAFLISWATIRRSLSY
jgi:hypothetical protein